MEDVSSKLDKIFSNLEADRLRALEEYEALQQDVLLLEPRYRHKVREVAGQILKLSIDASIGMAKIIEPIVKNEGMSSVASNRRELLELMEDMDKKSKKDEELQELPPLEEAVEELTLTDIIKDGQ